MTQNPSDGNAVGRGTVFAGKTGQFDVQLGEMLVADERTVFRAGLEWAPCLNGHMLQP